MQKRQYFLKPTIFGRSSPKLIGFLRKEEQIYMQNFKTIGSTSFELSRQKIDNKHTHTYTSIHFRDTIFFQCRLYINMKNGEILKLIFDTDSRLYSIQDWESKKSIDRFYVSKTHTMYVFLPVSYAPEVGDMMSRY